MTLQDYTTDELKAELKRRVTEARKVANANRDRKCKYLYAEGTVVKVLNTIGRVELPFLDWRFKVQIDAEDVAKLGILTWNVDSYHNTDRAKFNKSTAPKEGDRVRLKCRVTKDCPRWNMYRQPIIDEIIGKEVKG